MKFVKKSFIVLIVLSTLNTIAFSQTEKDDQKKSEYVLELIRTTSVTSVYLVAVNYHFEYKKEWLSNISVKGEFIIFRKGDEIHSWDVKEAIFIQKYGSTIKVRLKCEIGL